MRLSIILLVVLLGILAVPSLAKTTSAPNDHRRGTATTAGVLTASQAAAAGQVPVATTHKKTTATVTTTVAKPTTTTTTTAATSTAPAAPSNTTVAAASSSTGAAAPAPVATKTILTTTPTTTTNTTTVKPTTVAVAPVVAGRCSSTVDCNQHGVCLNGQCQCLKYFSGENCEIAELGKNVCPNKCSANGVCHEGTCLCIAGRTGSDCSQVVPTTCGNAPPNSAKAKLSKETLTKSNAKGTSSTSSAIVPTECNGNGVCFRKLCICKPGYFGDYCEQQKQCSAECLKNGVCREGVCQCAPDFTGVDCQISRHKQDDLLYLTGKALDVSQASAFTCQNGDATKCSGHGLCTANKCVCDEGFSGLTCENIVITGIYSSRCPAGCSDHGYCQLGRCVCDLGFTGKTCATKVEVPCANNCNGKGICEFGRCHCDPDYAGLSCETKLKCSVDCASKQQGVCVAGRCVCLNGYTGIDCSFAPPTASSTNTTLFAITSKKARFASGEEGEPLEDSLVDHIHTETSSSMMSPTNGEYTVSMPPVVMGILSFVFGVGVAFLLNWLYHRREESVRKQKMLKPLLATR